MPSPAFRRHVSKQIQGLQAGEFQCYDERALASLAAAAAAVDEAQWGKEGPHDAGEYNSWPEVYCLCSLHTRGEEPSQPALCLLGPISRDHFSSAFSLPL